MSETKILVPYDEYTKMVKDSAELGAVKALLATEFPDDTCQIIAIKSILGMIPDEEEEIVPNEPVIDPEPTPDDNEENEEEKEEIEPTP